VHYSQLQLQLLSTIILVVKPTQVQLLSTAVFLDVVLLPMALLMFSLMAHLWMEVFLSTAVILAK
jgi:hypothetical protein